MMMLALECFIDAKRIECLVMLKYMLRLAAQIPDHKLTICLFRLQGILHRHYRNLAASLRSFSFMSDAAKDIGDFK